MTGCETQDSPAVIAHRGASHLAPENTVASAKKAWKLGADGVEIDVYLSQDDRIMVMHDRSTMRTTGANYTIADTPSSELRKLDAGSWKAPEFAGEKLPFLEEIIETVPAGKRLFVEVKCGPEIAPALKKVIDGCGKKDRIDIISFGFDVCTTCKELMPDIPVYWLTSTKKDESPGDYLPLDTALIEKVRDAGLDGVDVHYAGLTAEFAGAVKNAGMGIYAWTVNDRLEYTRLASLGVDGVTTDRPGWIRGE